MKTGTLAVTLAAMALGGWAWAGTEATNRTPDALRLELDLTDGSRIVGVPAIGSVPVQTAYARMDIPLTQILAIQMDADHETAALELQNGDRIKGVLTLGPLQMATVFGAVSVGMENVRRLRVHAGGGLPPALREALALYYSFAEDEGGAVKDDSGNLAAAKVTGAKWTADGKRGGAYDFNGRDACITTPAVDTDGDATWSVWIRPRSFPTRNDTYAQFLGVRGHAWVWNSDNTSLSFPCQDSYGGSRLALLFFAMGKTGATAGHTAHIFPARPEPDRWYHVAGVWDSRGMHLYLNGDLLSESADAMPIPAACPLIIGANDNGPQRFFDGLIDEVMVFRKALSADEIRTLYGFMK